MSKKTYRAEPTDDGSVALSLLEKFHDQQRAEGREVSTRSKGRAERLHRLLQRQSATAECGNARGAPDCEKCGACAAPEPTPDRRIQIGPTDI